MAREKLKSRRRRFLFRRGFFFLKLFLGCAVIVSALAGYVRFRTEKLSLAYATSENVRREKALVEEVAAAEARYNEFFSAGRLRVLAGQMGFREPEISDFIYESQIGGGGEKPE